ncbi:MAG: alpha/beta fold hydrolase [Betaproteobacteria bacterium]
MHKKRNFFSATRFPWKWAVSVSLLVALAAAGCSTWQVRERELTFRVARSTASWFSGMPQGVQEFDLAVAAEGEPQQVHAWWWPASPGASGSGNAPAAPAVLYLHGTRWDLTGQLFRIEQLHDFGFSVLAIDYRGFGKSSGELPSEATVYEDAQVAWERLAQLQPDATRRFIYGHSLGGAVAIDLAAKLTAETPVGARVAAHGLIVESSFTSFADIARSLTVSWLPVDLLLSQKFDSIAKIRTVRLPVLIVHGGDDRMVPSRFSQALYDAAHEPKKLLLVEGATHNNSMRVGGAAYRDALREMFGVSDAAQPVAAQARLRSR